MPNDFNTTMEESDKLIKAKKKVKDIKGFYNHLTAYIIVNIVLLVLRYPIFIFFAGHNPETVDDGFLSWLNLNALLTPILWGIGLLIHYLAVFGVTPRFIKKWEERKINQYLDEDNKTQKWL